MNGDKNRNKKTALIVKIVETMQKKNMHLAKISLHQLFYIYQEIYSHTEYYEFKLFTYGPYSVDLTADLDHLFDSGILKVQYCQGPEYYGSKIEPGENYRKIFDLEPKFLNENIVMINELVSKFGHYQVRYLELQGAIIYLSKKNSINTLDGIITELGIIKPYFNESEIKEAYNEIERIL